jgi:hypothetical protein
MYSQVSLFIGTKNYWFAPHSVLAGGGCYVYEVRRVVLFGVYSQNGVG